MNVLAMIGYAAYPLMPPRLLNDCATAFGGCQPGFHFVDTMDVYGGLWSWRQSTVEKVSIVAYWGHLSSVMDVHDSLTQASESDPVVIPNGVSDDIFSLRAGSNDALLGPDRLAYDPEMAVPQDDGASQACSIAARRSATTTRPCHPCTSATAAGWPPP